MHYLYRTIAKREIPVSQRLRELGCDVYLPLIEGEALFPTYLFVNERNANLYDLNRIPGSLGVVTFGAEQAKVNDSVVEEFRQTDWQRSEECAEGSRVRIKQGPFAWREAIVKAKKADRIIVLMKILQQTTELELPLSEVEAA